MAIKRETNPNQIAFDNYISKSEERLKELKEALLIDRNDLDTELVHQPNLYYQVGEAFSEAISFRDEAKFNRDREAAELDRAIRREALDNNEKISEAQVANRVKENPSYYDYHERYLLLSKNAAFWEALKESFQQRSYAIKDLTQLWISGYYTDSVGRIERNVARDNKASDARDKMAEARRSATGYPR
jgi:hypothetical protein